ncbi:CIS tube protein [Vibrio sp. FJH11]
MLSSQPNYLKAGIVLLDQKSGEPINAIPLLINPDTLNTQFEVKAPVASGTRNEQLRLNGPPKETITFDAILDATDAMSRGDEDAMKYGIGHYIAALRSLISPTKRQLLDNDSLARQGKLTIIPMLQPLPVFCWGLHRRIPVKVGSLSVAEEFFSAHLNPLRAKASLSLQVLSVDDLGFDHPASALFLNYLDGIEKQAVKVFKPATGWLE